MTTNPEPAQRQTVFLVEDDTLVSQSLCNLLESANLAVQSFSSAEEFLAAWTPQQPGCLVLDVRLPGISGMELLASIAESGGLIPVIIMTAHGDIPMVRKALKTGAIEFLTKPFQDDDLLTAIEQGFAIDRNLREMNAQLQPLRERFESLSERERQVFQLVTDGRMNKEIADSLSLSLITVKIYRRQVMDKMHASSLADLVRMREKLTPPSSKA